MTWPLASTSAPPELPGLIAASVWIALVTTASLLLPLSDALAVRTGLGGDRAVQRADDAGGDGVGQAERVADRHHRLRRP